MESLEIGISYVFVLSIYNHLVSLFICFYSLTLQHRMQRRSSLMFAWDVFARRSVAAIEH